MEAPSAPSSSHTYPTEAARRTAFTEEITPELVWLSVHDVHLMKQKHAA